jgi:hypothetical protein
VCDLLLWTYNQGQCFAMASANLGTLTGGNLVLTNANGSINFLNSLASAPQVGILGTLFDKSFALDDGGDSFDTFTESGSTVSRENGKDFLALRTPNTGSSAVLQTKQYIVSSVGSSRIVTAVATLDPLNMIANHPGLTARVGTFDSSGQKMDEARGDGYFFQYTSAGLACVRRSSASGSDVDEVIPQAAWNIDRLDGSGLSGFTLSPQRAQVLLIVYESAASASSVKLGIVAGTNVVFAHRFDRNADDNNAVRTSSLPVRFELRNDTGEQNLQTELRALSCSVSYSGGMPKGIRRSCGLKAKARDLSSKTQSGPVLSIRLKQSFARATARLVGLHLTTTMVVYYEVVRNGTLSDAVWTSAGQESITEIDMAATAVTGGTVVASGYSAEKQTINISLPESIIPLASNIAGVCDVYSLNVVCLLASGLIWATMDVAEIS